MDEDTEEASKVANEVVEGMMVLVGDHDYSEEDLMNLVRDAMRG